MECVAFFVAAPAIEFKTDTRIASVLGENPIACSQRWIVAYVLPVTTLQDGSPVVFVVFVKTYDLLLHFRSAAATMLL